MSINELGADYLYLADSNNHKMYFPTIAHIVYFPNKKPFFIKIYNNQQFFKSQAKICAPRH